MEKLTTALAADGLIIVGRVKAHTDFRGPVESGLAKIMTIGLGKHRGAQTVHAFGTRGLAHWMPLAAQAMVRETGKVLAGLAILENAYDQTARLVGVPAPEIGAAGEAAGAAGDAAGDTADGASELQASSVRANSYPLGRKKPAVRCTAMIATAMLKANGMATQRVNRPRTRARPP